MSDLPRQDREAERSVCAALLLGGVGALDRCRAAGLLGRHFYEPRHEVLYSVAERLAAQGAAVDHVTMLAAASKEELRVLQPLLPELLGHASPPSAGALEYHAAAVVDAYALRALADAGTRISQLAATAPLDKKREALERARGCLDAVEVPEERESASTLGELVPKLLDEMEDGRPRGLSTGFAQLDHMLGGGPAPGQSVVVGARPSVGKTMLGCNMARAACKVGEQVVMFSLEMTRAEIAQRFVAMESGVKLSRLRAGTLDEHDWTKVAKATAEMERWPLLIDDEASMTVPDMRGRLRKVTSKGRRLGLVVIDYLQLVKPVDPRLPRQEQVASISAAVKAMGKDFQCPVLVLAQLSRATEQRRSNAPVLSDLRESGAIENDADVVILMHQAHEADDTMLLVVAKNRQGERGGVELVWHTATMRASGTERAEEREAMWEQRMLGERA